MMDDPMVDDAPVTLKREDRPRAPRRLRSQLAALDSHLLALQDDVEALFASVADAHGRRLLRALYGGLEEAHARVGRIGEAVAHGE
jgi:hypothetical protein